MNLVVTIKLVDASGQFGLAAAGGSDLDEIGDKIVLDGENTTVNGNSRSSTDAVTFNLNDLKPGDFWTIKTTVEITGNPGYAQVYVPTANGGEGENPEPEQDVDTDSEDDAGDVPLFQRTPQDNVTDGDLGEEMVVYQQASSGGSLVQFGTLDHFLKSLGYGLTFEGNSGFEDPRSPHNPTVIGPSGTAATTQKIVRKTKFELPTSVGNVVQGDTLSWEVKYQAEQYRNNDVDRPFNGAPPSTPGDPNT